MEILHVASEMAPIAKVGGLADVLMGLSRVEETLGHTTLTILPQYGCIDLSVAIPQGKIATFTTTIDGTKKQAFIHFYKLLNGIEVGLLDTVDGFWRKRQAIYGEKDELMSFLFFCRAVADWINQSKRSFSIIHAHDWPVSLLPVLLDGNQKTILTVHNFEYQGWCQWHDLARIGIYPEQFGDPTIFQDPKKECLNLIKAALLTVNHVTTVSPTYAVEAAEQGLGEGLEGILQRLDSRFTGILNGIDYEYWNPEKDPALFARYHKNMALDDIRKAKLQNKTELFSRLKLPVYEDVPLIASITRLVAQKGISFIYDLFSRANELDFQCILLGSMVDPQSASLYQELDTKLREQGRGAVYLVSDEQLAHQVYAAADQLVAPSIFEPCGLTQLIALRYGTIPIVRHTGGFADTILDIDANPINGNGFSFSSPAQLALDATCHRAIRYFHKKNEWNALVSRGMHQDFSWNRPGRYYVDLYEKVIALQNKEHR